MDQALLTPFPKKLTFLKDPDDYITLASFYADEWEEWWIKDTAYGHGLSCFMSFAKTLTLQQIKQVEFCPNRQGKKQNCSLELTILLLVLIVIKAHVIKKGWNNYFYANVNNISVNLIFMLTLLKNRVTFVFYYTQVVF